MGSNGELATRGDKVSGCRQRAKRETGVAGPGTCLGQGGVVGEIAIMQSSATFNHRRKSEKKEGINWPKAVAEPRHVRNVKRRSTVLLYAGTYSTETRTNSPRDELIRAFCLRGLFCVSR